MLVVAGSVSIDPANREAAVAATLAAMEATRQEEGCISYVISADLADPGRFLIFEEWESGDALKAHFTQPHMAAFQKAMGSLGVLEMKVQQYDVAKVGPIRR